MQQLNLTALRHEIQQAKAIHRTDPDAGFGRLCNALVDVVNDAEEMARDLDPNVIR